MQSILRPLTFAAALAALNSCACAPGDTCQGAQCSGGPDGSTDIALGDPNSDPGLGGSGTGADAGSHGGSDAGSFQTCASQSTKGESLPLDIYVMLDQSWSMIDCVDGTTTCTVAGTKWGAVTSAIEDFVSQQLSNVSVGIQFFATPPVVPPVCSVQYCVTDTDCGAGCGPCSSGGWCKGYVSGESCNPADYAIAAVEIAPLPGAATPIKSAITAHSPTSTSDYKWGTLTPTAPALTGAIDHARAWAKAHPGHVVIDILATDGVPSSCSPTDIPSIAAIAASGASGTPKILTFVIGIDDGSGNVSKLNQIAQGGGTNCDPKLNNAACIVTTGANTHGQFLAAMNNIRGAALGCTYSIPTPKTGTPDYTKVNVEFTSGATGAKQTFPKVADAASCGNAEAWHYNDPHNPTQIVLCKAACDLIGRDSRGQVDILLGCATVFK